MSELEAPVRIGILGAARIAPAALIKPAKENSEVVVAAVAARDVSRAQAFAAKHGIARVHDSYQALIDDPDLDAVYIPLPNGLHGRWTRAALDAGKHVLCEKPLTANAAEGTRGRRTGRDVRPGRDGGIPLPLPSVALCALKKSSPRVSWASWSGWRQPVLLAAEVL